MTEIPQGDIVGNTHFIQYSEDLWFALTSEQQYQSKLRWEVLAIRANVDEVVLQLIPDELFPIRGKEKPYIHWRHKLPKVSVDEWRNIKVTVVITLNSDPSVLTGRDREKFKQFWSKYPKGTRFRLNSLNGISIWDHTT